MGFDFAQPTLVERSRWHSLSVKRKPKPINTGMLFPHKSLSLLAKKQRAFADR